MCILFLVLIFALATVFVIVAIKRTSAPLPRSELLVIVRAEPEFAIPAATDVCSRLMISPFAAEPEPAETTIRT